MARTGNVNQSLRMCFCFVLTLTADWRKVNKGKYYIEIKVQVSGVVAELWCFIGILINFICGLFDKKLTILFGFYKIKKSAC